MAVLHITCEQCGKAFSFTTLPAIDTGNDPSWHEKVRSGEAFAGVCPHCGDKKFYDYSFLYKERETHTLVYYAAGEEDFQEACRTMTGQNPAVPWENISSWRRRIVANRDILAEKLLILDAGLDDRFVEMEKVLAYSFLQKKNPALLVDAVRFDGNKQEGYHIAFLLKGEITGAYAFDMSLYKKLKATFAVKLKKTERTDILIDSRWAAEMLKQ